MIMALKVYKGTSLVGLLDMQPNERFYGFTYDHAYVSKPGSLALSLSLPLTPSRFPDTQTLPFFEGLLPEGNSREHIARRLSISSTSPAKILAALGRDCAGDILIINDDEEVDQSEPEYTPLKGGIASVAENPYEEIVRLQEETRLSLAGAQEKIALFHKDGEPLDEGWFIPLFGAPSTHIIKPGVLDQRYPHLALNEFLCLRAAAACGIPTVSCDILFQKTPLLIVKRYDRVNGGVMINGLQRISRIHQEDCCQACGVDSMRKYQRDGGPGFDDIRTILIQHAQFPMRDLELFVKQGLFNYLIGNCDAHAKNFSLLQNPEGTVSLAPAYDLLSTAIYDGSYGSKLNRSMAMRIGLHENIDRIGRADFSQFAKDVHLRPNQIKLFAEELIRGLEAAFQEAAKEAQAQGFPDSDEIISRILKNSNNRADILLSL